MNTTKVIEVSGLAKTYKTTKAIAGTSFFVEKGEIFGILGPNGAGKTTTLEIIEGLKQQTGGKVEVLGLDNLENPEGIKKRIGVQLQSSEYLPYLTLGELLDLFASFYGQKANKKELLGLVDLVDKQNELVKNLSGGQKQRFTIATSLVNKPEILFLDEPTTGLDPAARHSLWDLVKKINATGITVVLTTHYMEEAEFLCHRVAIMDQGKILEIDEPQKLIQNLSHTTQVSFFTAEPIDENLFKNLPEVTKAYSEHPKTILEIKSLDHLSLIIEKLKQHHINFSGFTVKTATLEDVYLKLTGKEFQE
jgi:ABC-2 type transport system ATP-binding protein